MDVMDVDPLSQLVFALQYGQDYQEATKKAVQEATKKEIEDVYEAYKEFFYKYHQDNPGATTDCYKEYLKTLVKQGKQHTFIGRIEEQRGEEFEYCYWFYATVRILL
ncbi:11021_t:CDS:1, partial [Ambispora leptoticha]